ncbi:hypothetical protein AWU82_23715 [Pseudomonas glycinae]|uniref:Uncharacterized protein n=1 Tax=Pseudomonas glycinae TaxID=1785145 RepID=A0ABM5ZR71_9PSED|nr:hypothetical protein AWU82_23715 [Pseudomonas glycinae]
MINSIRRRYAIGVKGLWLWTRRPANRGFQGRKEHWDIRAAVQGWTDLRREARGLATVRNNRSKGISDERFVALTSLRAG